jgi:hypothetical protein
LIQMAPHAARSREKAEGRGVSAWSIMRAPGVDQSS